MAAKPYYEDPLWLELWLDKSKSHYVEAPGYGDSDVRFRTLENYGVVPFEVHADERQVVKVLRGVGLDVTLDTKTHYVPLGREIAIPAGTPHKLASVARGQVSFQSEYTKA